MSCEKLQKGALEKSHLHPAGCKEQEELLQLAIDIATNCYGYRSTHTSRLLAELSGNSPIPEFLRKFPEKQKVLVRNGILNQVVV